MTRRTTRIYPACRSAAWLGLSLCTGVIAALAPTSANAQQTPPALYRPAQQNFTTSSRYVSADLFTWFTSSGGQTIANWTPQEGRSAWTGNVPFWRDQLKQIMSANIDTLYVHIYADNTTANNRTQRQNLFSAMSQLRAQGYDVPKVAPWYDSAGYGVSTNTKIDLATAGGRSTFINQYTTFFTDYYAANTDAGADSYLHQVGGKVVLNTWQNRDRVVNHSGMTRADMENALKASFAAAHPVFNNGVRMTTLSYIDPNVGFVDEMVPQYQDTDHAVYYYPGNTNQYDGGSQPYWNNYKTATIKPGFWVQNADPNGRFQARNGGANYKAAWDTAIADATLKHVKIESWNEYTEGSGIFRANTTPVRDADVTANDTWSSTNDPLEYVKTTATKANAFNDNADRGSLILFNGLPTTLQAGQTYTATFVVRNTGDLAWTNAGGYKFGQETGKPGDTILSASLVAVDETQLNDTATNSFYTYGGVFRGAPVTFQMQLTAPGTAGTYSTHWSMFQTGTGFFGDELAFNINVVPEPISFGLVGPVLGGLGLTRRRRRDQP
jgi:hypothetical protein